MIKIRVPATSANLGPGFDCLGLALSAYNTFSVEKSDELILEGFEERFSNENNMFVRAYRRAGGTNLHVRFEECGIPVSRGLGSSAAMTSAGILAYHLLNKSMSRQEVFMLAGEMEGHPDNAAPCLFGGLTACLKDSSGSYVFRRLPLHEKWHFTVLIPDLEVRTDEARKILPASYSRSDAAGTAAHAILMCEALRTGDTSLLKQAAVDVIHEPYRKKLIPHFDTVKTIAEEAVNGVMTISGSGSACLLISDSPLDEKAVRLIRELPENWRVECLHTAEGAQMTEDGTWKAII